MKYTYDDVKEIIESKGCKLLSKEYKNNKTNLKIQCKCGNIINRSFQDFKNKKRYYCPECTGNVIGYKKVKQVIELYGNKLISKEYKNRFTPLLIKCKDCGEVFETTCELFQKSKTKTCPKCAIKIRNKNNANNPNHQFYSFEDVKNICEITGESKLISTEYNPNVKLKLQCECGNIYEQTFYHITDKLKNKYDIKCPHCMAMKGYEKMGKATISKGEKEIENYLLSKNIEFEREFIFKDCIYNDVLRFDFYISSYNLAIEYDGRQHYEPVSIFGGEEKFKIQQIKDEIKNNYCKNNNINLLRIPYYDNVKEILDCYFIKQVNTEIIC